VLRILRKVIAYPRGGITNSAVKPSWCRRDAVYKKNRPFWKKKALPLRVGVPLSGKFQTQTCRKEPPPGGERRLSLKKPTTLEGSRRSPRTPTGKAVLAGGGHRFQKRSSKRPGALGSALKTGSSAKKATADPQSFGQEKTPAAAAVQTKRNTARSRESYLGDGWW